MLKTINLSKSFSDKKLFENVNLKFTKGNNYGVIGANGAGKSTFLKILTNQIEATSGDVIVDKGKRISFLEQDHFKYNDLDATEVVIMGFKELYQISKEKDIIYNKEDFSEEDGIKAAELEEKFGAMGGYESESNAQKLLSDLGLAKNLWNSKLKDLKSSAKVKVLLAKALFANPDILIMDEPTNHLDLQSITWLENFLINYNNGVVIVVSHDSLFLDNIATHILDIDFSDARIYVGNYSFWKNSSEFMLDLMKKRNIRQEEKVKKLEDFIAKFSANASKSKQATSRKKSLEKINIEEIKPSSRKYPYIRFDFDQKPGKQILKVENVSFVDEHEETLLKNVTFSLKQGEKMVVLGDDDIAKTKLLEILVGKTKPTTGKVTWGQTIKYGYLPSNNDQYFQKNINLLDWIRQWTDEDDEQKVRSFLGKVLFSADQVFKKVQVTSGGEKVRLMLSKLMMEKPNFLILDQPLDHLDTESIDSLTLGIQKYESSVIFTSYNKGFINANANVFFQLGNEENFIFRGNADEFLSEKTQERVKNIK